MKNGYSDSSTKNYNNNLNTTKNKHVKSLKEYKQITYKYCL